MNSTSTTSYITARTFSGTTMTMAVIDLFGTSVHYYYGYVDNYIEPEKTEAPLISRGIPPNKLSQAKNLYMKPRYKIRQPISKAGFKRGQKTMETDRGK